MGGGRLVVGGQVTEIARRAAKELLVKLRLTRLKEDWKFDDTPRRALYGQDVGERVVKSPKPASLPISSIGTCPTADKPVCAPSIRRMPKDSPGSAPGTCAAGGWLSI